MKITIDGPVACGKTAVGRALARRIPAKFLDTGMMYRAVTWASIQERVDPNNNVALASLTKSLDIEISTARFANVAFSDGSLLYGFDQRICTELGHSYYVGNINRCSQDN